VQYEEARALIQAAINLKPSCAKYRHSLGVACRACGKNREAVEALEWANEKDPMNIQARVLWRKGVVDYRLVSRGQGITADVRVLFF
jgi:tetratricopeptide (TPR) repeat protein